MSDRHALITGPVTGVIPTPHPDINGDEVDVTPDVLYFDTEVEAVAVAAAIKTAVRGD